MGFFTLVLLAIGLSFDSFAVSVSSGLLKREIQFLQAARIAIILAVFQGGMPIIGWFLGSRVKTIIEPWDHWVAFFLLTALGTKMVYEAFKPEDEREFNPLLFKTMLSMAHLLVLSYWSTVLSNFLKNIHGNNNLIDFFEISAQN